MKNLLIVSTSALCLLLAVAVPLPEQDVQLVQIPLEGNKELDILSLPDNQGQLTDRNKRTIGVLRQLFPELSKKVEQVIEEKVQLILPIILRNVGPLLLRGGLGGLSGGGATTSDDDDDEADDDSNTDADTTSSDGNGSTSTREGGGGRKVSISLPTFPPDTDDEDEDDDDDNNSTDNKEESNTIASASTDKTQMTHGGAGDGSVDIAALSERLESINRVVRQAQAQKAQTVQAESKSDKGDKADSADANTIATALSKEDSSSSPSDVTESKAPAIDELTLEDENDDENRNKRFLSFGFGGSGSNGSGGSGNFLFDIIRRTADRAARAAGTIYRVAAGTESFDLDINNKQATRSTDDDTDFDHNNDDNDSTSRKLSAGNDNGLIGGSAGTEQTDESENAPEGETTIAKNADGYTEGIPGPVTRLFVLANRGLANLIQDLILRIAQTSERVVNFKARLITSLI